MPRPVKAAAQSVKGTGDFYRYLGEKFEKYGLRVTVVQVFPKPIFDIKIKDRA